MAAFSKNVILFDDDLNERYVSRLLWFLTHHSTTDFCVLDARGIGLKCVVNESDRVLFFIVGLCSTESMRSIFPEMENQVFCNITVAPLFEETQLFSVRYGVDNYNDRRFNSKNYNEMLKTLFQRLGINEAD